MPAFMTERGHTEIQDEIIRQRGHGARIARVRLSPQRLKLIEAEFIVQHENGQMLIERVPLVGDAGVPYERFTLDSPEDVATGGG